MSEPLTPEKKLELLSERIKYLELLESDTKIHKAEIFINDMQILISVEEIKKLLK